MMALVVDAVGHFTCRRVVRLAISHACFRSQRFAPVLKCAGVIATCPRSDHSLDVVRESEQTLVYQVHIGGKAPIIEGLQMHFLGLYHNIDQLFQISALRTQLPEPNQNHSTIDRAHSPKPRIEA